MASIVPADVSARKPGRPAALRTDSTSTPQRIGAAIFSAYSAKYSATRSFEGKSSGPTSENSSPGNRSCQAGPLATRESHRSDAPAFGDPVPLEHEVRDAGAAQVLAHGQAGLAAADHQRLDALGRRRHGPTSLGATMVDTSRVQSAASAVTSRRNGVESSGGTGPSSSSA